MLLIRHSQRANNAVRTSSASGELFVASVVICMILAAFGDAVDPTVFGEVGLEFAIFDFGGELTVLAMRHWHLVQLLLAGAVVSFGIFVLRVFYAGLIRILLPVSPRSTGKIPIEL
jgi:hypothetical protein